jgi:hypothetical protein
MPGDRARLQTLAFFRRCYWYFSGYKLCKFLATTRKDQLKIPMWGLLVGENVVFFLFVAAVVVHFHSGWDGKPILTWTTMFY